MPYTGIQAIRMSTSDAGLLVIPGVKDAERVRDMLAEIDAIREV